MIAILVDEHRVCFYHSAFIQWTLQETFTHALEECRSDVRSDVLHAELNYYARAVFGQWPFTPVMKLLRTSEN